MRRFSAGVVLLFVLAAILLGALGCGKSRETGDLTAVFMDIGKADAILLYTDEATVLIDVGYEDTWDTVSSTLRREGREKIDYLILTHYDRDHIGGAPDLLRTYPVGEVLLPAGQVSSDEYAALQAALSSGGVRSSVLTETRTLTLAAACTMRVDATRLTDLTDENNASLICEVRWNDFGMLLLGDAMKDRVDEYLDRMSGTFQVVKTPHHGDYFKKLEECLAKAGTKDAVACVGPEREVEEKYLAMCEDLGITSWRTDEGEIRLTYAEDTGDYTLTQKK